MAKLNVYTDGGARGNPGPAAIGVFIVDEQGKEIVRIKKGIGKTTNNVAEYTAVIEALDWLKNNYPSGLRVDFFLDSRLIVNQLNGLFKIKNKNLRELIIKVRIKEMETGQKIIYHHIPREKNRIADFLVNSSF